MLALAQPGEHTLQLGELLLVVLEGLVLRLRCIVEGLDRVLEVVRGCVDLLEQLWVQILLVIKLGDLLL